MLKQDFMNKMFQLVSLLFFFGSLFSNLNAQEVRKYSNEFLNIGVGAEAIGLGNTKTATSRNLYSFYYNPASLVHVDDVFQAGYMHSEYFAGIAKYDYLGVAVPIDSSRTIGVSFIRFGIDDIPNTLELFEPDGSINYDKITKFTVADYALYISYAQKIKQIKGLDVGGNLKIIHRSVGPFAKAWGFGIDLALNYQYKNWRFGLMAKDVTSTYNAWSFSFTDKQEQILLQTDNFIPVSSVELTAPSFNLGASYIFDIKKKFFIEPMVDFLFFTDGRRNVLFRTDPVSIDARFGLELNYSKIVYLRTGFSSAYWSEDNNGDQTVFNFQPTIGVGVNIKDWFFIDYAFANIGNGDKFYSHVISAHFAMKTKPKKKY